jgi:hypothetical protein
LGGRADGWSLETQFGPVLDVRSCGNMGCEWCSTLLPAPIPEPVLAWCTIVHVHFSVKRVGMGVGPHGVGTKRGSTRTAAAPLALHWQCQWHVACMMQCLGQSRHRDGPPLPPLPPPPPMPIQALCHAAIFRVIPRGWTAAPAQPPKAARAARCCGPWASLAGCALALAVASCGRCDPGGPCGCPPVHQSRSGVGSPMAWQGARASWR